jgi:hypothetical protein
MTLCQPTPTTDSRQEPFRYSRLERARATAAFFDPSELPRSQRQFARDAGIPRSTLGDWLRTPAPAGVDPVVVAFFQTPRGEALLHRLLLALLLVFVVRATSGIRSVSLLLRLSGLDAFVGSSFGALQQQAKAIENHLGNYDDAEFERLAGLMTHKRIALCADENFHVKDPCLVAIEPASGFILAETFRPNRDADTWTEVIEQATAKLPVEVVRLTSDQARGLVRCARHGLSVPHAPDLFHAQRDLQAPLLSPLRRELAESRKTLQQDEQALAAAEKERQEYHSKPRRPGRAPDHDGKVKGCQRFVEISQGHVRQDEGRLERTRKAVRGLGDDLHPFDEQTGQPLTSGQVEQKLEQRLKEIEQVVQEANLAQKASDAVGKTRALLPALVAGVAWFWLMAQSVGEEQDLSQESEEAFKRTLLPALYWEQAAGKAREGEQARKYRDLAERLRAQAIAKGSPLTRLTAEERADLEKVGQDLVGLLARASSCVEGRNGRLALILHGKCRLTEAKLKALKTIHNYFSERADGTTAAERFFRHEPTPLFEWLLDKMPDLPRPAAKRPKKAS